MKGGDGVDVFTTEGADLIADFGAGNTGPLTDDDSANNDFVDLTSFYNATTLAVWNAADPGQTHATPLAWLRADQANGVLEGVDGLRIQNGGAAVDGLALNTETTGVVCFARGTRIRTARSDVPVETLRAGDLVMTADGGCSRCAGLGRVRSAERNWPPIPAAADPHSPGRRGRACPLRIWSYLPSID